jgi:hypothetical protein
MLLVQYRYIGWIRTWYSMEPRRDISLRTGTIKQGVNNNDNNEKTTPIYVIVSCKMIIKDDGIR